MASRLDRLRSFGSNAGSAITRGAQAAQGGVSQLARDSAKRAAKAAATAALMATGVGSAAVAAGRALGVVRKHWKIIVPLAAALMTCMVVLMVSNLIVVEHMANPLNWPETVVETIGCSIGSGAELQTCAGEYFCKVIIRRVTGEHRCFFSAAEVQDLPIMRRAEL